MGRDHWHYKSSSRKASPTEQRNAAAEAETIPASGCLCAVFNLFDFHHLHFAQNHQQQPPRHSSYESSSSSSSYDRRLPSIVAPRNSFELHEHCSTPLTQSRDLNISVKMIRTSRDKRTNDISHSSEIISSPGGSKTPSLVARLMGLDLLPDELSTSSSSHQTNSNSQTKHHLKRPARHRRSFETELSGTRSLPETPRVSSSRRSDVEHRFSLSNKENCRSPGLKPIGRRGGLGLVDITNTSYSRRDEKLLNSTPTSSSSRLKASEKSVGGKINEDYGENFVLSTRELNERKQKPVRKCKRIAEERFRTPPPPSVRKNVQEFNITRTKKKETFVSPKTVIRDRIVNPDRKCKKESAPPATISVQKQVKSTQEVPKQRSKLSSFMSHSCKSEKEQATQRPNTQDNITNNDNIGYNNARVGHVKGCPSVDMSVPRVATFSGMDCRVLEEIEALVEKDWSRAKVGGEGIGDVREWIGVEIEKEIFGTLISEIVWIYYCTFGRI